MQSLSAFSFLLLKHSTDPQERNTIPTLINHVSFFFSLKKVTVCPCGDHDTCCRCLADAKLTLHHGMSRTTLDPGPVIRIKPSRGTTESLIRLNPAPRLSPLMRDEDRIRSQATQGLHCYSDRIINSVTTIYRRCLYHFTKTKGSTES